MESGKLQSGHGGIAHFSITGPREAHILSRKTIPPLNGSRVKVASVFFKPTNSEQYFPMT